MSNIPLYLSRIVLFLVLIHFTIDAGPTQRYLESHSIEEMGQTFSPKLQKKFPLLLEIADQETENTFFGYHGMSQNNRLFQDVLHVVFEEVLEMPLPDNFYFLRIPGEAHWNWPEGRASFFASRKILMPDLHRELIIKNFFAILKRQQEVELKIEDFTKDEYAQIWTFFQDFIHYSVKNEWMKHAKKYAMPCNYSWEKLELNGQLPAFLQLINSKLKQLYPEVNRKDLCTWLQEHFADEHNIRWTFLLFDPALESYGREIDAHFFPFDDTAKSQQASLVAMNLSIFGNHTCSACFSPKIFLKNQSVLNGDKTLENDLQTFFAKLGLDPAIVTPMWNEGKKILEEVGAKHGCLLQFFDESALRGEKPFSFVDQNLFISFKHAIPVPDLIPSKYIQGNYSLTAGEKDLEFRMLMDNRTTLNPFSPLRMVRHDELSLGDSQKILVQMKKILRKSTKDEAKILRYKEVLENMWDPLLDP